MKVDLDKWYHCEVNKEDFVKLLKKSDYEGFKHMACLLYTSDAADED